MDVCFYLELYATLGQASSCGSERGVYPSPSLMVPCPTNMGRKPFQPRSPLRAGSLRLPATSACRVATPWLCARPNHSENARKAHHLARYMTAGSVSAVGMRGSQGFLVTIWDSSVWLLGSSWCYVCRISFALHALTVISFLAEPFFE